MGRVLCVCSDLIFATKITGTASAVGCDLQMVRGLEQLETRLGPEVSTVIVDLGAAGGKALEVVRRVRQGGSPPRIVAYVSHVDETLAAAARAAGADDVIPRSAFSARLPEILAGA